MRTRARLLPGAEGPSLGAMAMPDPIRLPFWLRPTVIIFGTLGIPALLAMWLPDQVFLTEWQSLKYFTNGDAMSIAAALGCFALGAGLVSIWGRLHEALRQSLGAEPTDQWGESTPLPALLRPAFMVVAALTILATLWWIISAAQQGLSLEDAFAALGGDSDAVSRIRARAVTLPGITTMTQFAIALAVLAGWLWRQPGARTVQWIFAVVILLTLVRSIIRAERLAFIELMIPFFIAWLPGFIQLHRDRPRIRLLLLAAPFAAVAALFGYFMLAEAGRSYEVKVAEGSERNLVEYSAIRFEAYYGTALNNGAYFERELNRGPWPYYALEWIWRFPGVDSRLDVPRLTGLGPDDQSTLLSLDLNPEFNNPSGYFSYRYDFGQFGVLVFFLGLGIVAGSLHAGFRSGRLGGRLLYPVFVIGLLEIARVPYFTSTRVFPAWIALLVILALGSLGKTEPLAQGKRNRG